MSAAEPPVSVLVPVYNTAKYLRDMIASVQNQTHREWELIVLDDGSTDDSLTILQELAAKEPRMRVVSRPNKGLVESRNELAAAARGAILAWMDSDDVMTPRRLELQLARFNAEPRLLLLGGAATLTDPVGLPIKTHAFPLEHEAIVEVMKQDIAFYMPTVSMRKDALAAIGGFRQPFAIGEDFDAALRLSERGRVANLPEVLVLYRQHLMSTANAGRAKCAAYHRLNLELAAERRATGTDRIQRGEMPTITFEKLPMTKAVSLDTHRRWAWWALQNKNLKTARKYAWKSLRAAPLSKASWNLLACTIRGR